MAKIDINQDLVKDPDTLKKLCPFNAIDDINGYLEINAACKMCKICIKKGPLGLFTYCETDLPSIDKEAWRGITVYVDHIEGEIHPVTYELIGKARELAAKISHPVICLFMGSRIKDKADELLSYGVDQVYVYENEALKDFRVEPYTAVFEDFIYKVKPSIILVGGTTMGRSLAPRTAARLRTGLTADCTILDVQENTDLDQIRPAFGGNIMAHIHTPHHRPQFATVRYKIFDAPEKTVNPQGKVLVQTIDEKLLKSNINVLEVKQKEKDKGIEEADVIVVAGRALKKEEDMAMVQELADLLDARYAATRPLIEAGWADPRLQIGLSGRTVKPKLIITCGVSGAIQFVAGMNNSDCIIAINQDKNAPIFKVAHYGIIGDIYQIIPGIIRNIKNQNLSSNTADKLAVLSN